MERENRLPDVIFLSSEASELLSNQTTEAGACIDSDGKGINIRDASLSDAFFDDTAEYRNTDMRRIFKTPPPPYRVGTRTADAYGPATDEQRKYMERQLAVREYVNLPKDNRMETLAYIIADLKAENMMLTERVHQLTDDYNDVARQLRGMEKRKDDLEKQTLGDMLKMRDHCDKLEKDNEQLKRQCAQLQIERNEAKTHADECYLQKEDLFKHIARFENSEFLKIGDACTHRAFAPDGNPVKVGSGICYCCRHLIKVDASGKKCVLCACCYDNTKAEEAQA